MIMKTKPDFHETYFTTFDLGLAAALIAAGYTLDHLDKTNPNKAQFAFKRTYGVEETFKRFWDMKLHVDAQTYFNALKLLKNRLYSD